MEVIESPRVTPFNGQRVSFGRHETFPLRYAWLTKGFESIVANPNGLHADDATVQLGVGRNMIYAIRYWLRAARMAEPNPQKDGLTPTHLGTLLFGHNGLDQYLEDEATIWLIHWLLASNPHDSTAWYWFFNHFHKPEFTSSELSAALGHFTQTHITAKQSLTKAKQDAAVLLRMYARSKTSLKTTIEESLDSPLSTLRIITYSRENKRYQSRPTEKVHLPVGIFAFAIAELFSYHDTAAIPVQELMNSRQQLPAPGSIFRLTESALIAMIETLTTVYPSHYELRDTAGLNQLYRLGECDPYFFLSDHYSQTTKQAA